VVAAPLIGTPLAPIAETSAPVICVQATASTSWDEKGEPVAQTAAVGQTAAAGQVGWSLVSGQLPASKTLEAPEEPPLEPLLDPELPPELDPVPVEPLEPPPLLLPPRLEVDRAPLLEPLEPARWLLAWVELCFPVEVALPEAVAWEQPARDIRIHGRQRRAPSTRSLWQPAGGRVNRGRAELEENESLTAGLVSMGYTAPRVTSGPMSFAGAGRLPS